MKLLLTGASGFIGQALVPLCQQAGIELTLLLRQPLQRQHDLSVASLIVDLNDAQAVQRALQQVQPDALIHLAWQGIPDFSADMCQLNVRQGQHLIDAIANSNCQKVLFTGTCMEYRGLSGQVKEQQVGSDLNEFGQAKSQLCQMLQQRLATRQWYWLRPFFVYGPGQRAGSLIPTLLAQISRGEAVQMQNPQMAQDFVHVQDVAKALLALCTQPAPAGIYNIGSGELTQVAQIAHWLQQAWRGETLSVVQKPVGGMLSGLSADLSQIRAQTNWQPQIQLANGLQELVQHAKQH